MACGFRRSKRWDGAKRFSKGSAFALDIRWMNCARKNVGAVDGKLSTFYPQVLQLRSTCRRLSKSLPISGFSPLSSAILRQACSTVV